MFTGARHHLRGFWGGGCSKGQHRCRSVDLTGHGVKVPSGPQGNAACPSPVTQGRLARAGRGVQLIFLRKCLAASAGRRGGGNPDVVAALGCCFHFSWSFHGAGSLGLASVDMWGWIILCRGDCPAHRRVLSGAPGLCPLDAGIILPQPSYDNRKRLRASPSVPLGGGGDATPRVEHHCLQLRHQKTEKREERS